MSPADSDTPSTLFDMPDLNPADIPYMPILTPPITLNITPRKTGTDMCSRLPRTRILSISGKDLSRHIHVIYIMRHTAITPVIKQIQSNTSQIRFPTNVPTAPTSFTSPAPRTRIANNPNKTTTPTSIPRPLSRSPSTPCAYHCASRPFPAIQKHNRFEILYVLRSATTAPNNHIPSTSSQIAHLLFRVKHC